jgi:hypothetical protein
MGLFQSRIRKTFRKACDTYSYRKCEDNLSKALKGGVFSPPSFLLLRSPLYVNWRENTSVAILYAGL